MARPAMTFRPEDLEEDAPPPYAPTAPDTDSTVPNPEQHRQSYPALDTSYVVQQQQLQQQQLQQLQVGLPTTPPPPIHYYPVMSSGTSIAAPPPVVPAAYPQYPAMSPALVSSTPNVPVTTTAPTAPEENLIDLDDTNGRWEPELSRVPHAYISPVLPPMSAIAALSPTPAPAPVPATSPVVAPAQYVALPPPVALPDLVTLYKCRKCGATLDSDTAVCKRIHVGGFSGERQASQATEADLNERRKLVPTGNSAANESSSTVGSSISQATFLSSETVHDSNHGARDVHFNHQQHNGARRSEELPAGAISSPSVLVGSGTSSSSMSCSGALGRATSMVNPSSTTHQYHTAPSTNDNHGTNDTYIRRSFSTQNPVTSLKKLWKDTKKELSSIQQPPYSSMHHELVAPPPLPPMQPQQQQQPYPQPGQYHSQQSGYPILGSSTAAASRLSTNPFDDPTPTPIHAYNPAHVPLYIPELPMQRQQQQQQTLPAPSAPPGHPW
ncbi:hypothetical protein BGW39_001483 [Mortierella sp. 14UC]|nr:hypothetical protein BGW39_001483 [Mortierella sp. 14UC]